MATTTGGTTYVTSSDLVANYPTASLSLANRVDVVASGGPVLVKTSGYTITVADILGGNKFLYNSASPGTFTLPASSLLDGMVIDVSQIGAGALTVSGGTIVGTTVTTAQYQGLRFVYVASGTTWYSIAPNATAPGLALITPTSIANSGGSASATGGTVTFTGVTSISLNGVFSSTYENYKILVTSVLASGTQSLGIRLRVSGTDDSTSNYAYQYVDGSSATVSASRGTATNKADIGAAATNGGWQAMELFRPFGTVPTLFLSVNGTNVTGPFLTTYSGAHNVSTAFDGITVFPSASNFTGTIRVYGYRS